MERPVRYSDREAERRLLWLGKVLDAYFLVDQAIYSAAAARREVVACHKGCSSCCHQIVPTIKPEYWGVEWYAAEKIQSPVPEKAKQRLERIDAIDGCPFLVDDACAVYPLRPLACRMVVVFNAPCEPDPGQFATLAKRPGDFLNLLDLATSNETAIELMLEAMGFTGSALKMMRPVLVNLAEPLDRQDWRRVLETNPTH